MNAKTLAIAIAFAAGSAFAANAQTHITTLDTVQVRPSADQIAQQQVELNSNITTLAVVEVRPSAGLIAEYHNELAASRTVTTLAAVQVRPSQDQREALAAEAAANTSGYANAMAVASAAARQLIITMPVLEVRPSELQLQSLAIEMATGLIKQ